MDEFSLIRKLTERKQSKAFQRRMGVSTGIGDDAAVGSISPGFELVMSCDTMVEGVHFNQWTMKDQDIGFKALASNVSDMAAMGAVPKFGLVSIGIPAKFNQSRLKQIYSGLYECAEMYKVAVVGGDTTSSRDDFFISITIMGEVEKNKALLRSAAQPADAVFITGLIGQSAAGLDYLMKKQIHNLHLDDIPPAFRQLVQAHRKPLPSVKAGRILLQSGSCHALNDISDGLASEVWEIAEASKVGIVLYEDSIPIARDLKDYAQAQNRNPLDWSLYGGEDYVLVGTAPSSELPKLKQAMHNAHIQFYNIGEVVHKSKGSVQIVDQAGNLRQLKKEGYHHF